MADQGRSRRGAGLSVSGRSLGADDPVIESLLARCTFPDRVAEVDCAVSGGADSAALLILAVAAGYRVHAFHVDHGIREGSEREAVDVEELAARLGARFSSLHCRVDEGPDLEARAREARHGALPPGTLLGHTMDDQAETVMLRILRGTGPAGLAAMGPSNHPILGLRRAETEALCTRGGVQFFRDPSNLDPRFRRNRVRRELLPLMNDISERDLVPLLARLASQSSEQADLLSALASTIDPADAKAVAAAPSVLAAEALRIWWTEQTGHHYPPDAAALDRMLEVARGTARACDVGDGWSLRRTNQRLRLERSRALT